MPCSVRLDYDHQKSAPGGHQRRSRNPATLASIPFSQVPAVSLLSNLKEIWQRDGTG